MPLTEKEVMFQIRDRLSFRWQNHMKRELAIPVAAIGMKVSEGKDYGSLVLCCGNEFDRRRIASILRVVAAKLESMPNETTDAELKDAIKGLEFPGFYTP